MIVCVRRFRDSTVSQPKSPANGVNGVSAVNFCKLNDFCGQKNVQNFRGKSEFLDLLGSLVRWSNLFFETN